MNLKKLQWYSLRRTMLKAFVPEWVWPNHVILDGVKIPVRGTALNFGTKRWIANGLYECDERNLIESVVKPGMTVVEMGGSIGILARILAHKVGPNGRVISIEASSDLAHKARTWCDVPSNLSVIQGFAFPLNSAEQVSVSGFETDGSELDGRAMWAINGNAALHNWDLSRIHREHHAVPEVLVVDIEGGEGVLISQSANFPETLRCIVLEFHPQRYGIEGTEGIIERLRSEGFTETARSGMCARFERILNPTC